MDRTRVAGRKCLRATSLISPFYFLFDATIIGLVNYKYTANQLVGQNKEPTLSRCKHLSHSVFSPVKDWWFFFPDIIAGDIASLHAIVLYPPPVLAVIYQKQSLVPNKRSVWGLSEVKLLIWSKVPTVSCRVGCTVSGRENLFHYSSSWITTR